MSSFVENIHNTDGSSNFRCLDEFGEILWVTSFDNAKGIHFESSGELHLVWEDIPRFIELLQKMSTKS